MALPRPANIDEKLLAAVDGEWRTAAALHAIVGEGSPTTARSALIRLANARRIERRYDAHQNGQIARYRRVSIED